MFRITTLGSVTDDSLTTKMSFFLKSPRKRKNQMMTQAIENWSNLFELVSTEYDLVQATN